MKHLNAPHNGHTNGHANGNGHALAVRPKATTPALGDRLPPQNLEAERGVLGSVLLDGELLDDVIPILAVRDFYRDSHQVIYDAIRSMYDLGHRVDPLTLADELTRRDQFQKIGGDLTLRELVDSVPHAANAVYYAGIVREKAISRRTIETATEIIRRGYSNQYTARELVAFAEEAILDVDGLHGRGGPVPMDRIVGEVMDEVERMQRGEFLGVATGFEDLDDVLCGLPPGSVTVLAARPSIGKTALGMAIGANVAARSEPVLFFSLEMSRRELGHRYLAAWSKIDNYDLRDAGKLNRIDRGWQRLHEAAGRLSRIAMEIDDSSSYTVAEMIAVARRFKRSRGGLGLILVDYLGLTDGQRSRGMSRQEEVAEISRGIKRMAGQLDCAVLALHQLNRKPEGRDDHQPQMSDLRDSGAIEQDAHSVLLLHRPEFYDKDIEPGIAHLIIAKNRNGQTTAIKLAFKKEWAHFDSHSERLDDPANDQPF